MPCWTQKAGYEMVSNDMAPVKKRSERSSVIYHLWIKDLVFRGDIYHLDYRDQ